MTKTSDNTYFKDLSLKEKQSKLSQFAKVDGDIVIWQKGQTSREKFSKKSFNRDRLELEVSRSSTTLKNKDVLYTFSMQGLNFFGKGKLKHLNDKAYILDCKDSLYKSERRNNFRLLTFPVHKVYVHMHVGNFGGESNVVSLQTGMSQTGLFKSFLAIVGDEDDVPVREGYVAVRVLDISVTGLALHVSEMEKDLFKEGSQTGKVYIDFNGEEIEIPDTKIVYVVETISQERKVKVFKIGIQFLNVDDSIDHKLGSKINEALRDFTSEFEDFIK
jgi:hypothetical protein